MSDLKKARAALEEAQRAQREFVSEEERIAKNIQDAERKVQQALRNEQEKEFRHIASEASDINSQLDSTYAELRAAMNEHDLPGFLRLYALAEETAQRLSRANMDAMEAAPNTDNNKSEYFGQLDWNIGAVAFLYDMIVSAMGTDNEWLFRGLAYTMSKEVPTPSEKFDGRVWTREQAKAICASTVWSAHVAGSRRIDGAMVG
jgi:hypothetical protein